MGRPSDSARRILDFQSNTQHKANTFIVEIQRKIYLHDVGWFDGNDLVWDENRQKYGKTHFQNERHLDFFSFELLFHKTFYLLHKKNFLQKKI